MLFGHSFALCLSILIPVLVVGTNSQYAEAPAKSALYYSKASYCESDAINTWLCEGCAQHPFFKLTRIYLNTSTAMQGYSGVSEDHIVVAFRGSQNFGNWINNLDFTKRDYVDGGCVECQAHRGFLVSYTSIKRQLLEDVKKLVQEHPTYPILVTGHSLGGAVATFAAAELAFMQYEGDAKPKIELYTFGAPRVGNQAFADWFARLFCAGGHTAYRIVHNADIVPHTTTMAMGFVHVGEEVWYDSDDATAHKNCKYVTGEDCDQLTVVEDKECSNSLRMPISVDDHLLYLGVCTSCSCGKAVSEEPISAQLTDSVILRAGSDHKCGLLR